MRILVVEDEIRIRKGLTNLIEKHTEHTVVGQASNGAEGKEMALLYVPDLIITDIRMPVMDGLEMMKQLKELSDDWRFVILSGYSEFEYAKKALQYGADDYLVKPLAPEDVMKLFDTIEERIRKERQKSQEKPEKILRNYLIEKEEISIDEIKKACGFEQEKELYLICAYVGNISKDARNNCIERITDLKNRLKNEKIVFFFTESTRELIILMERKNSSFIKKELEEKLLKRKQNDKIWVWTGEAVGSDDNLRSKYEHIREFYEYALVIDTNQILDQKIINECNVIKQELSPKYKKNIQNYFFKKDKENFKNEINNFLNDMRHMQERPGKIKEEYIQMAYFLSGIAKENDSRIYSQVQDLNIIQNIGNSVTQKEIEEFFIQITDIFINNMGEHNNISNYVILRAIDYIRNHYQEGISLDAVSESLNITPEYLSTLFNREMGENFTVFLKKFRISHAKRLLKETDKKIYEIAIEVGYSDPKYFNRVFKEEEGISPGDFRALK